MAKTIKPTFILLFGVPFLNFPATRTAEPPTSKLGALPIHRCLFQKVNKIAAGFRHICDSNFANRSNLWHFSTYDATSGSSTMSGFSFGAGSGTPGGFSFGAPATTTASSQPASGFSPLPNQRILDLRVLNSSFQHFISYLLGLVEPFWSLKTRRLSLRSGPGSRFTQTSDQGLTNSRSIFIIVALTLMDTYLRNPRLFDFSILGRTWTALFCVKSWKEIQLKSLFEKLTRLP